MPIDSPPEREQLKQYNQSLACETPVTLAKLLGIPVIHVNHCGKVTALNFPNADKLQTRQYVGAAQIIDRSGNILARRHFFEDGGFVISDISWDTDNRKNTINLYFINLKQRI